MPQDLSRINILLQRYVQKTCTREELDELFARIAEMPDNDTLQQLVEEAGLHMPAAAQLPEVDYESVYNSIIQRPPAKRRKLFTFSRVAAAAVILLLAGAAYRWWLPRETRQATPPVVQQLLADVAPGGNKATLTLADGSTVTLDSTGQREINTADTRVTQQNGQLLYGEDAEAPGLQYHKLSTPRGGQFKVTLPDGTRVWLNSASSLRYPTAFTGKERTVELEGQGYFEVAQNATQPFKVMVQGMEVQVLGTHFDVMAYGDEATINTTLLEGAVKVKAGENVRLLQPEQEAVLDRQSRRVTVQQADVKKVMAWKNGLFVFNNMALPAILREVARWYDVDIVYQATPSSELYGGGISRNLHLSNVLHLLEASGYNHFKIEGKKIVVLP
ncbi:FecR family protein [Chitinophaga alhagiae]|uniref:FecR family protein n=1 Tax=Chitinophaga alhagiae TaxID=2203219 RepID=UPI000E5B3E19|nr:FecR family protein [Chitinophaga alhagiae]